MVRWEVPPQRRLAFTAVLLTVAASVVVTVLVDFRAGGYVLAGACALAASFRAVLPEQYCLGLLVRSRRIDVTTGARAGGRRRRRGGHRPAGPVRPLTLACRARGRGRGRVGQGPSTRPGADLM